MAPNSDSDSDNFQPTGLQHKRQKIESSEGSSNEAEQPGVAQIEIEQIPDAAAVNPQAVDGKCRYCHKLIASKSATVRHEKICVENPNKHTAVIYKCEYCNKSFKREYALHAHLNRMHGDDKKCRFCDKVFSRREHKDEHEMICGKRPSNLDINTPRFHCPEIGCDFSTIRQRDLPQHIDKRHNNPNDQQLQCEVPDCEQTFLSYREQGNHYQKEHDGNHEINYVKLDDFNKVTNWLTNFKHEHGMDLTKRRHNDVTTLYTCSRAGRSRRIAEHRLGVIRAIKKVIKTCRHCTAYVKVTALHREDGTGALIEYCAQHIHETSAIYQKISPQLRSEIVAKLNDRKTNKDIVRELTSDIGEVEVKQRRHYITESEVERIAAESITDPARLHKDDLISTQLMIEEHIDEHGNFKENSPFIFYEPGDKKSGKTLVVGLQTKKMGKNLEKHGHRGIGVDTTHKMCAKWKLLLTTFSVMNAKNKSIPILFVITESEAASTIEPVLRAMSERFEVPSPKYFMSDLAENFWNAWTNVFGKGDTLRLYCDYHLVVAWTGRVYALPDRDYDFKEALLGQLRKFRTLTVKAEFDAHEADVAAYCSQNGLQEFWDSFARKYMTDSAKLCFAGYSTAGSIYHTNTGLEAFHHTLKHIILQGKHNHRLDVLIMNVLLRYADDVDRMEIQMTDKPKFQTQREYRNHRSCAKAQAELEKGEDRAKVVKEGEVYMVSSFVKRQKEPYTVRVRDTVNHAVECGIECGKCFMCACILQCNCPDGSWFRNQHSCKHAHYVNKLFGIMKKDLNHVPMVVEGANVNQQLTNHRTPSPTADQSAADALSPLKDQVDPGADGANGPVEYQASTVQLGMYVHDVMRRAHSLSAMVKKNSNFFTQEHIGQPAEVAQTLKSITDDIAIQKAANGPGVQLSKEKGRKVVKQRRFGGSLNVTAMPKRGDRTHRPKGPVSDLTLMVRSSGPGGSGDVRQELPAHQDSDEETLEIDTGDDEEEEETGELVEVENVDDTTDDVFRQCNQCYRPTNNLDIVCQGPCGNRDHKVCVDMDYDVELHRCQKAPYICFDCFADVDTD